MTTATRAKPFLVRLEKTTKFGFFAVTSTLAFAHLTPYTPAASSLWILSLGYYTALTLTRFDSSVRTVAARKRVRFSESLFTAISLLAVACLPSGPTVGNGLGGALVVAGIILGGWHLARRNQRCQPTVTRFGLVADSWGRIPGRRSAVALLVAIIVLGGALNVYSWLGPLFAVAGAVAAGSPYWSAARQDAQTRMTVSQYLSGSMVGGEWTSLRQAEGRAPVFSLKLNSDGVPTQIVLPVPPGMAAHLQPSVEEAIHRRLASWGTYSFTWLNGSVAAHLNTTDGLTALAESAGM